VGSAADVAAIKSAYIAFFDPNTDLQKSLSLLQDGADFKDSVVSQGNSSYAKQASVTVSKVVVNSADKATVIFSVLLNKSPILANQTGYSVRQGGVWKVAGVTFCGLLAAQGTPPPACSKPAATALPS
jgi:predicted cobalt transporter CbtA